MDAILVLNAGSSSMKFAVFERTETAGKLRRICKGHLSESDNCIELRVQDAGGNELAHSTWHPADGCFHHDEALGWILAWLGEHRGVEDIAAVGHRVVHGGLTHTAPVRVTDAVLRDLETLVPLAPLHLPQNLKAIGLLHKQWPDVPQVACFDTAFHRTQPAVAQALALPREITDAGIRRFGFHGLSFEYIASQVPRVLGTQAGGKVVVAHLGNGASLCAMQDGKSVATTMGFSVLDGLVMGTRCGSLDAGVMLYLQQHLRMGVDQLSEILYKQSGLLGVSGISSDMHVLLDSKDPRAVEAVELFVYRTVLEIGAMAAATGGIDALVFTAGIGEHSAPIRKRICDGCEWLGVILDDRANAANKDLIHAPASRLKVAVVPADEEYMIALHTQACVPAQQSGGMSGN